MPDDRTHVNMRAPALLDELVLVGYDPTHFPKWSEYYQSTKPSFPRSTAELARSTAELAAVRTALPRSSAALGRQYPEKSADVAPSEGGAALAEGGTVLADGSADPSPEPSFTFEQLDAMDSWQLQRLGMIRNNGKLLQ